jgi:hypothetical protein
MSAADSPADAHPEAEQIILKLRRLITVKPELQQSVVGFLDLLEDVASEFPDVKKPLPADSWSTGDLVPVIGSTAAGPARFWEELDQSSGGPEADRRLEELLSQNSEHAVRRSNLVMVTPDSDQSRDVALIQLSQPDVLGFVEFLSCPAVKLKYPKAVSWRIDGVSMSPRHEDGDFVITSPDHPAIEGHPCVARQQGQIGVNCKIYRRDGDDVVLIPVNESLSPQRCNVKELLWAHRVLYSVRLAESR